MADQAVQLEVVNKNTGDAENKGENTSYQEKYALD